MSNNFFKTNSRFASLLDDDVSEKKKDKYQKTGVSKEQEINEKEKNINSFKNERQSNFKFNGNKKENNNKDNKFINESKNIEKKDIQTDFSINNFPELGIKINNNLNNNDNDNNKSYIDKLKKYDDKSINEIKIDPDLKDLKPGCIMYKRDKITGKTIIKSNYNNSIQELSEKQIAKNIANSLVALYEKRTKEYIDTYGYDNWEKMFKFTNYDYGYFDRLDEEYEEMMEKDDEENSDEEDYNDY